MQLYYFHVENGRTYPDHCGTMLPDLAGAKNEALRCATDLLSDQSSRFLDGAEWTIRVTDAADLTLFTVMFTVLDAPAISTGGD